MSESVVKIEPQAVVKSGRDGVAVAEGERARAMVQARVMLAYQNPRDIDEFRRKVLADCKRPGFAATARYAKPVGGKNVDGFSIRFIESAMQHFTNVQNEVAIIAEDDEKVTYRFTALDLESNVSFGGDVVVAKTVERSKLREGETGISSRTNSYGKPTYLVKASDDEMLVKAGNIQSKGMRTWGQRLLPADVLEEAKELCRATIAAGDAAVDPTVRRKKVVDSFTAIGVEVEAIKQMARKSDLDLLTDDDAARLRGYLTAIRDGDETPDSIIAKLNEDQPQPEKTEEEKPKEFLEKLKASRDAQKKKEA